MGRILLIIFLMWLAQFGLGYFQIKHYNTTMKSLKGKGNVYVGRQKGRLGSGSIILIVLDRNGIVIDFLEMKGITVFERFKKKEMYIGKSAEQLMEDVSALKKENATSKAIKTALQDFSLS